MKYKPFDQGVHSPATMSLVASSAHGGGGGGGGGAGSSVPGQSQNLQARTLPSDILRSLKSPADPVADGQPRQPPQIIEFLNMRDYTTQVDSIVDIGEPIFQAFPPKIIFHGYEAHSELVARLSLRNNDNVSRRVKILRPQSPFVTVEPEITSSGQKKSGNKVAPGMETHFRVKFRPSSDLSFKYNLVVATEREKYIVPIDAIGCAPALDLPDRLEFPPALAKSVVELPLLVRNVGTRPADFSLRTSEHFSVRPTSGSLGIDESLVLVVAAAPPVRGECHGELFLTYSEDQNEISSSPLTACCALSALGEEADVRLSTDLVEVLSTFISTLSQKTFTIVNNSDKAIDFRFKTNASAHEDARMLQEMEFRLADAEMEELRNLASNDSAQTMLVQRKYRNLFKRAQADAFLFKDDQFSIHPVQGTVTPFSEFEVTVRFVPNSPREQSTVAFCEVSGKTDRIPLTVKGQGDGPKAVFSYDVLDVGDTFINTLHQYEVELLNRGEIEAEFRLVPPQSTFGQHFRFEPDSGVLGVGEALPVRVLFESDILGEFSESFSWEIKGASESLVLDFRGRVVGPTFELDCTELDFGVVSYGFRYSLDFTVTNTSEIPMKFRMRIRDGEGETFEGALTAPPAASSVAAAAGAGHSASDEDDSEASISAESSASSSGFVLIPSSGTLLPMGKQTVTIELISKSIRRYDTPLLIDIPGVGDGVLEVPVNAECMVPRVTVTADVLDFGECFLRHPYKMPLQLVNDSKLPAKFEVLTQNAQSRGLAEYEVEPKSGGIAAWGSQQLEFTLSTTRLGRIHLPVRIRIVGSQSDPLEMVIAAKSVGPRLQFGLQPEEFLTAPSIDFGKRPVLVDATQKLFLNNPSLIPAEFKTFIEGRDSTYQADKREGRLEPGESTEVNVTVNMDDVMRFRDKLHILVVEGDDTHVPLSAVGTGTTITCPEISEGGIDFGNQFTNQVFSREIVLQNQGRRSQTIVWTNSRLEDEKAATAAATGRDKGNASSSSAVGTSTAVDGSSPKSPVFKISPERTSIAPKTSCVFLVSGSSSTCGLAAERLICNIPVDKGAAKTIGEIPLSADLANPFLQFSDTAMEFSYCFVPNATVPKTLEKPLTIKNISKLPLRFQMLAQAPFSVQPVELVLKPGQHERVKVYFDIEYCQSKDKKSSNVASRIMIQYVDNPQRDTVELRGEINYPSIDLSAERVDFGCVLQDTTARSSITLTNSSRVDAIYNWAFLESGSGANARGAPMNSVFDILPIRGLLSPGQSEIVEFSYSAHLGPKASGVAVCQVEGGADYQVALLAESDNIKYSIDPKVIDLGIQPYEKTFEREVQVHNPGKVPCSYRVDLSRVKRPGVLSVSPTAGTLEAGQREVLMVKVRPGIPDRVEEHIYVEVAHFEPERVTVMMEGIYPCCHLTLPREPTETFSTGVESAKESFCEGSPAIFAAARIGMKSAAVTSMRSPRRTANTAVGRSKTPRTNGSSAMGEGDRFVPTKVEIELEADRVGLCKAILKEERDALTAEGDLSVAGSTQSSMQDSKALEGSRKARSAKVKPAKRPARVVSEYCIDFGNVVKGTQRVKRFRLQNLGWHPITVNVDKKALRPGVIVEPDSVQRLPGQPEFGTADMALTLKTGACDAGPLEWIVPLSIRNSPKIHVALKAVIVVPGIVAHLDQLNFGEVRSGTERILFVKLHNPKEVPATWTLKKPMEASKDWAYFKCEPDQGTLMPGESQNVAVTFCPVQNREEPYLQKLPLKVGYSSQVVNLVCRGTGYTLKMRLDPPSLNLGALLPGQKSNSGEFRIVNDGKFDIEVFSLDFDKQYLVEEEMLRRCDMYGDGSVMKLETREAQQGLWAEVLESDKRRRAMEQLQDQDAATEEALAAEESPEGEASATAGEEGVGEIETPLEEQQPVQVDDTLNIVLHGAKSCRAEQASRLAARYGLAVLDVKASIESLMSNFDALPDNVRAAVRPQPTEGEEAEASANDAFSALLKHALQGERFEKGVIVDGLEHDLLPPGECFKGVLVALGLAESNDASEQGEDEDEENSGAVWSGSKKVFVNIFVEHPPADSEASGVGEEPSRVEGEESAGSDAAAAAPEVAQAEGDEPPEGGMPDHTADPRSYLGFDDFHGLLEHFKKSVANVLIRKFSEAEDAEALFKELLGIKFRLGKISTVLPSVFEDEKVTPDPYTVEIVQKPAVRPARTPVLHFKLLEAEKREVASGEADEGGEPTEVGGVEEVEPEKKTRWVVPAHGSVTVRVDFDSEDVGTFREMLGFEVMGGEKYNVLMAEGVAAHPQISQDFRNVYYSKVKAKVASAVSRQFVISRQMFEFGPLLAGKDKGGYEEGKHPENSALFRITNCGLFEANVDISLRSSSGENAEGSPFIVEPASMSLKVDETQDLSVYAFPTENGLFEEAVVCSIEGNPNPVVFPMTCLGDKPLLEIDGLSEDSINFGRLLLGQRDTKTLVLRNTSNLLAKWNLSGLEDLPSEISVEPAMGELAAHQEATVTVNLSAEKSEEFEQNLILSYGDVGGLDDPQEVPISVTGEAYSIDVDVKFPEESSNGLDFGLVKVVEDAVKEIQVVNTGKYPVGFQTNIRTQKVRTLFEVEPSAGTVPPGDTQTLQVRFNSSHDLAKEVTLIDNNDISLHIIEELTGSRESTVPIRVNLQAVFCKYSLRPARGINFGPLVFNSTSQPRTFEISNTGVFPFDFRLFAYGEEEEDAAAARGGSLSLGNFTVSPASGTVEPGTVQQVSTTFLAENSRSYCKLMGIEVSDRDPSDHPGGVPYEISGESCIPGINSSDFEGIFEEHLVKSAFDPYESNRGVFALREKCFDFGAVVAQVDGETDDRSASMGTGMSSNLKISNPHKVPCTVNFSVHAKGDEAGAFPMDVSPAKAHIPAHEHRYVTVTFDPRSIGQFSGVFEATVEGAAADGSAVQAFRCELRGEGTLPTLSLSLPGSGQGSTFSDSGEPVLQFPRLRLGKEKEISLVVRNDGSVPARGKLEMASCSGFYFEGVPSGPFELAPKRTLGARLVFSPEEAGEYKHKMQLSVEDNRFDSQLIDIVGEGYVEDVAFEGLPDGLDDELRLTDTCPGTPAEASFTLTNQSAAHLKFQWNTDAQELSSVTIKPSAGHLHQGMTKTISVKFAPTETTHLVAVKLPLKLVPIEYEESDSAFPDWDDSQVTLAYPEEGGEDAEPECCMLPEPTHTAKDSEAKDIALTLHAHADSTRYECETGPIQFKTTTMFQSRTFSFPLKNISTIDMPFSWVVRDDVGTPSDESPFSVSPSSGTLAPEQTLMVTVRFSPLEVEDWQHELVCEIPNLDKGFPKIERSLRGKVSRPWCHFLLPESDYLSSGRRPTNASRAVDPNSKVIEFESLGSRVRNVKRFFVLNPTDVAYEFSWDQQGGAREAFRCVNRKGTIAPGKRFEMAFEYTPEENGELESGWVFCLPRQGIKVPFLLVGRVIEPRVALDRPALNFGKVILGGKARETIHIINSEHLPFNFSMDKTSFGANPGMKPEVHFEPMQGVVPPNSSVAVAATFIPAKEGNFNFNVVCNVKKKPTNLNLNIKGEGYAIHDAMHLESEGGHVELVSGAANPVKMGRVLINEKCIKRLHLLNTGDINYNFVWDSGKNQNVVVTPAAGTVPKGERLQCELSYSPSAQESLDMYALTCKIQNSHKYVLNLTAQGHRPKLDFSFHSHNFGPCFIQSGGPAMNQASLRVVNNDIIDISCDLVFESTPYLEVKSSPTVLAPGEFQEIPISFLPKENRQYEETLAFEINGLFRADVQIKGEGCPVKVELFDVKHANVNFGSLMANQSTTRYVKLVNRSKIPTLVSLAPSLLVLQRYGISAIPAGDLYLKPREAGTLTLNFHPTARLRQFFEEIPLSVSGETRSLFNISGACLGTELKLASESLPFGAVSLGSKVTKRLQLENTGDVITKFSWDSNALGPNFTISPAEGFLAPHQEVMLDVCFHPESLNSDVRVERVSLFVEGAETQYLTVTGMCVQQEAEAAVVTFSTNVRCSETKNVSVKNTTNTNWVLKPVVSSENWSAPEVLSVKAGATAELPLTYKPLSMTGDSHHEGSVFFPLPDGSGILHNLTGEASEPNAEGEVAQDVPAKAVHVEVLPVKNWLNSLQRLRAIVELDVEDPAVQLTGPEYIDIPGSAVRDYKLRLFSFKECKISAKVTFKNDDTGEFVFYVLKFSVGPPSIQGNLSLECAVRQQAKENILIKNPLGTDVTIKAACANKQVSLPDEIILKPSSEAAIEVKYRPLLVEECEETLTLTSEELGIYSYSLSLRGLSPGLERSLVFNVPLGSKDVKSFRFMHYLDEKSDYSCKLASGDAGFSTEASIVAHPAGPEGIESEVDVTFEPTRIGSNFKDTLLVKSAVAGEFICPVIGRCIAPKPQGPFDVKGKGEVPFKNIFPKEVAFHCTVDNPAFSVNKEERIPAKKATVISISYQAREGRPSTTKLTVTCPESPEPWLFYLQGN